MKTHRPTLFILLFVVSLLLFCSTTNQQKPNFIIIFCDDLGYGDLGCFGSTLHRTPHIDRIAQNGMRLTSFYSTSGVCTPSRSSLMTGCYPRRVSMHQDHNNYCVLFPVGKKGLHPDEVTIAEILKEAGYATACIGKWHLGDQSGFLPTRQGFDYYYGIPYSNDMGINQGANPPLPLLRNETVIEAPVEQSTITKRYTEEAVAFIKKHKESPFFLYLPHTMPHNPVHASDAFRGRSANDGYGDAVEEIDWSTGEIIATLKELGLEEKTLMLFTSDNGAAQRWGGSNGILRGWKGSVWEGGQRVPCVVQWPGHIPASVERATMTCTMDLLPTLARLAGVSLPNRRIDGKDITPVLLGESTESPHDVFYFYQMGQLQAVRSGPWKLHLPLADKLRNWGPSEGPQAAQLYHLENDCTESHDLAAEHPAIVEQLLDLAHSARQDLGDLDKPGAHQRAAEWVEHPQPLRLK
ncbi:arylsulfatase [candidate division KSB1 bacterium]|nr:sulfatase [candidate division KSB1 bacterium]RQW00368.1 MAG: arylsulfatase [candidate division KSB1 bacterium]